MEHWHATGFLGRGSPGGHCGAKVQNARSGRGGCAGGSTGLLSGSLEWGQSHKYTNRSLEGIPSPWSGAGEGEQAESGCRCRVRARQRVSSAARRKGRSSARTQRGHKSINDTGRASREQMFAVFHKNWAAGKRQERFLWLLLGRHGANSCKCPKERKDKKM